MLYNCSDGASCKNPAPASRFLCEADRQAAWPSLALLMMKPVSVLICICVTELVLPAWRDRGLALSHKGEALLKVQDFPGRPQDSRLGNKVPVTKY